MSKPNKPIKVQVRRVNSVLKHIEFARAYGMSEEKIQALIRNMQPKGGVTGRNLDVKA